MRYILTILFLISVAYGQHYFVVPTMNNPENKAMMVSKRFYQLSRPVQGNDVAEFLFGWVQHPLTDSVALVLDTAMYLPKGNLTATEITNWISETYGSLTTTQRNTLTNYINSNNLLRISRLIINTRLKLWTREEMEARGWFNFPNPL